MERHIKHIPAGLTHGARSFVQAHGVRLEPPALEEYRERWLAAGVPDDQIDRAVAFERTWGGIVLPPSPCYDGGPKYLDADVPGYVEGIGWCFEVGTQRTALPYSFQIGPDGAFGILDGGSFVPLHESIEGWIEAVSLAHHAASHAAEVRKLRGATADTLDLDLGDFEEVRAVRGLADRWWWSADSLIAICRGESTVYVYSGLDEAGTGAHRWAVPTGWHVAGSAEPLVGWDVNGVLIERRRQGLWETWFEHPDGRRMGFITNGARVMLILTNGEGDAGEHAVDEGAEGWSDGFILLNGQNDRYANHDTVAFGTGIECLRRIIDLGTWPEQVRRESGG